MAKVELDNIAAFTQAAITTINQNNGKIEVGFDNTLSRDGTGPNQMEADLDMNHNAILNIGDFQVENLDVQTLTVDGQIVGTTVYTLPSPQDLLQYLGIEEQVAEVPAYAATVSEMKALDTSVYKQCHLYESGKLGLFIWTLGDFTAQAAADTNEGLYVKSTATAVSVGMWVRKWDRRVMKASWFGTDQAALVASIARASAEAVPLVLGDKGTTWTITSGITIPANLVVYGREPNRTGTGTVISATGVTGTAITVSSGVTLVGIELQGPGNASYSVNSKGIVASGTNNSPAAPTFISNIILEDCLINGFGHSGISYSYVTDFRLLRVKVTNIGYTGVQCISCLRGKVTECEVIGVWPGTAGNVYGYAFTKLDGEVLDYPRSEDIYVFRCLAKNCERWHGFDTHGGSYIIFDSCVADNCGRAFILTSASNGSGELYFAPQFCGIVDCVAKNPPATKTDRGEGAWIQGAIDSGNVIRDYAWCCYIRGCTFIGYGFERVGAVPVFPGSPTNVSGTTSQGCITMRVSMHSKICDNYFYDTIGDCIYLNRTNQNFIVEGNNARDWQSQIQNPAFLRIVQQDNMGIIVGNRAAKFNASSNTYVAEVGVAAIAAITGTYVSGRSNTFAVDTAGYAMNGITNGPAITADLN